MANNNSDSLDNRTTIHRGDGILLDHIRDLMETIMEEVTMIEVIGLIIITILATAITEVEDHTDTIKEEEGMADMAGKENDVACVMLLGDIIDSTPLV